MTIFWIVLAAIVAACFALFQYGYFSKRKKDNRKPWFALLRAATVFCILLLILIPAFQSFNYTIVKPTLMIAVDNSKSIEHLGQSDQIKQTISEIQNDVDLTDRFNVIYYSWGDQLNSLDTLDFNANVSNQDKAITELQKLNRENKLAIVMLTDGNQTSGSNYAYSRLKQNTKVYPILYGDTTRYDDLSISQINNNRYSFLNNEFPVEVFVNYDGTKSIEKDFAIYEGSKKLFNQKLKFNNEKKSHQLNINLKSDRIGLKTMRAVMEELSSERNVENNSQPFVVEVIDQQTKVLIHAAYPHPDIGALKKAIESNEQRSVDIEYTSTIADVSDYNLVIFYGVGSGFKDSFGSAMESGVNIWLITGFNKQIGVVNEVQNAFKLPTGNQSDDVQPILNTLYRPFDLESLDYDDFPPVKVPYGNISVGVPHDVLSYKQINGIETDMPFWLSYEEGGNRYAITAASGLWRWRAQSYLNNKDFRNFDDLVNSQVQYLASRQKRNRLDLQAEPFYYQNNPIVINARYLDKNYVFDDDGVINMQLKLNGSDSWIIRPFILKGNNYRVDLSGLSPGRYDWKVSVENDQLSKSGQFEIIEFDIEAQAFGASNNDFEQLVGTENIYYNGQWSQVKERLFQDNQFKPVQQQRVSTSDLIDFKYLLAVLFVLLAAEWFLRKYNGLI